MHNFALPREDAESTGRGRRTPARMDCARRARRPVPDAARVRARAGRLSGRAGGAAATAPCHGGSRAGPPRPSGTGAVAGRCRAWADCRTAVRPWGAARAPGSGGIRARERYGTPAPCCSPPRRLGSPRARSSSRAAGRIAAACRCDKASPNTDRRGKRAARAPRDGPYTRAAARRRPGSFTQRIVRVFSAPVFLLHLRATPAPIFSGWSVVGPARCRAAAGSSPTPLFRLISSS